MKRLLTATLVAALLSVSLVAAAQELPVCDPSTPPEQACVIPPPPPTVCDPSTPPEVECVMPPPPECSVSTPPEVECVMPPPPAVCNPIIQPSCQPNVVTTTTTTTMGPSGGPSRSVDVTPITKTVVRVSEPSATPKVSEPPVYDLHPGTGGPQEF